MSKDPDPEPDPKNWPASNTFTGVRVETETASPVDLLLVLTKSNGDNGWLPPESVAPPDTGVIVDPVAVLLSA